MDNQLQALVEKWRERAAGYLRSAGTLDSFELVRDITTAITRAYERMAADRTECADELAALLVQRAQPPVCECGYAMVPLPPSHVCTKCGQREAQPAPSPWQPIETAPEDGTPHFRAVYVVTPEADYWDVNFGRVNDEGEFVNLGGYDHGWQPEDYTHWTPALPLPSPPTTEADPEEEADAYWEYVKRTAAEVAKWPAWKLGRTSVRETRVKEDPTP